MENLSGLSLQYRDIINKIKADKASGITPPGKKEDEASFKTVINKFIDDVDQMQKVSDQTVKDFASGEVTDIHQVMVAAEEANLSFQLMMEVRNRLLESYREIMRMQG